MLVLSATASIVANADDRPPTLSQYITCSKALGIDSLSIKNTDEVPIVLATRGRKTGFYVYTDTGAYFFPFGKPGDSNAQYDYYYYQLSLPKRPDMYFVYSIPKLSWRDALSAQTYALLTNGPNIAGAGLAVLGGPISPDEPIAAKRVKLTAADNVEDRAALEALSAALQKSVGSVTKQYKDLRDVVGPSVSKASYADELKACALKGDKDLQAATDRETDKLEHAGPSDGDTTDDQSGGTNKGAGK